MNEWYYKIFPKKELLLQVKETESGIITYINPQLKKMESAYKNQLIAFLNGVNKDLGRK